MNNPIEITKLIARFKAGKENNELYKPISAERFVFSEIYGRNIYQIDKEKVVHYPFHKYKNQFALQHYFTKEKSYMVPVDLKNDFEFLVERILNPPASNHIIWPYDIVIFQKRMLEGEHMDSYFQDNNIDTIKPKKCKYLQSLSASSYFVHDKTPMPTGYMGLVFNDSQIYDRVQTLENFLRTVDNQTWHNKTIINIAVNICKLINEMNQNGYIYPEIHPSKFLITEDNDLMLLFSDIAYSIKDMNTDKKNFCRVSVDQCSLEFADPMVMRKEILYVDDSSQNISLASFLFYLFVNHYPYYGDMLMGYPDDSAIAHQNLFLHYYYAMTDFIFQDNTQNGLEYMYQASKVKALWAELPSDIKNLFVRALSTQAVRRSYNHVPTPEEWLEVFKKIEWI